MSSQVSLPAEVVLVAVDGTVTLHPPTVEGMPWLAFARAKDSDPVAVLWMPRAGLAATYVCAECGASAYRSHCSHTWAATEARNLAERHYR